MKPTNDKIMEAIYLQSMTDFVLDQKYTTTLDISQIDFYDKELNVLSKIRNYATFLKQPLQLGFFVPCDENGNVLKEPKRWNDYLQFPDSFDGNKEWGELYNYELAIERLLFKGFYIENFKLSSCKFSKITSDKVTVAFWNEISLWAMENKFKNIESLASCKLELTQTAIKQIGL